MLRRLEECLHVAAQTGARKNDSNPIRIPASPLALTDPHVTWSSFPSLAESRAIRHLKDIFD